jgi:O-Antigen ligase
MASAIALALYAPLIVAAAVLVWRRPVLALYAFIVGLALHNAVMAGLHEAGVRGASLSVIQAWKEVLLAAAALSIASRARRAHRLPFRPAAADGLALAFVALVVVYALIPQDVLGGEADSEAVLLGARHALLPVAAYFVGRSLSLGADELRRLGWTILATAAAVAAVGLVEEYTVSVERWRDAGVPAYFREQLGFDYRGPGGMPENFAFNTDEGLFRRLVSTFLSPLASAFLFAVALLLAAAGGPLRRWAALPLAALVAVGLLFTLSRSTVIALAAGFLVLAFALRRPWPLTAAVATVGAGLVFAATFTSFAPTTHFFPNELEEQKRIAQEKGGLPESELSLAEPSIKSHLTNLRDGLETVLRHPQGYGLGNAGAIARRRDVELRAGESNYAELGVEVGLAGMLIFVAWNALLLVGLLRAARRGPPLLQWAAAGLAAALAAVLALGLQTDAFGVPWLAYTVWCLAGSLLVPVAAAAPAGVARPRAPGLALSD